MLEDAEVTDACSDPVRNRLIFAALVIRLLRGFEQGIERHACRRIIERRRLNGATSTNRLFKYRFKKRDYQLKWSVPDFKEAEVRTNRDNKAT